MKRIISMRAEKRFYECVGVRYFQKLTFLLEKVIHRSDKGKNTNYHFRKMDMSAIDAFEKYLFYNGSIHVRNLVFFMIYVIVAVIFKKRFGWYDSIVLILALKDLYCVMLQRYNYLRLKEMKNIARLRRERRIERRTMEMKERFIEKYESSYACEDLEFIKNIKERIRNGENIVIGDKEEAVLKRISEAFTSSRESE